MRLAFTLFVSLSILASSANAVCPATSRMICAEYFQSDAVVQANLLSARHVVPKDEMDGYVYTLQPVKTIRGKIPATFEVYEENSSGRAAFR